MSIFSEELVDNSTEIVLQKIEEFKNLFDEAESETSLLSDQSKLLKFLDNNPSKVRCAMLSWLAIEEGLR